MNESGDDLVQRVSRESYIDLLRGVALLGVMSVNVLEHLAKPSHLTDSIVSAGVQWLAVGKFYPLFAALFALGCLLQWDGMRQGKKSRWELLRRSAALYICGLFLYVLITPNQILLEYAVLAPLIWCLAGLPLRIVCVVAVIGLGVTIGSIQTRTASPVAQHSAYGEAPAAFGGLNEPLERPEGVSAFHEARLRQSYEDLVKSRWAIYRRLWPTAGSWRHFAHLITIACCVIFAYRRQFVGQIKPTMTQLRHAAVWTGAIAMACLSVNWVAARNARESIASGGVPGGTMSYLWKASLYIGSPVLSMCYASIVLLVARCDGSSRWAARMIAAGRMSLTNFILQGLVISTVFLGHGLGFEGRIGPVAGLLLVTLTWCSQITMSKMWLQRYRYGPVEWLSKCVMQWQRVPLRSDVVVMPVAAVAIRP